MIRLSPQNVVLQIRRCYKRLSKDILQNQSKVIDIETGVRVSALCKDNKLLEEAGDAETVFECFKKGVSISADKEFLGWKASQDTPYKWLTYREVDIRSKAFGDGLVDLGVVPGNDTRVGVHSQNRPEYFITDMGLLHHSICPVPFYNHLEMKNLMHIMNHAGIKTMVVDKLEKVKNLMKWRKELPLLERIVIYEKCTEAKRDKAEKLGIQLYHISEVEEIGMKKPLPSNPPKTDDLYIVCYTSGTTGVPKGVNITHYNLSLLTKGIQTHLTQYGIEPIHQTDTMLSFLPLAHIYERFLQSALFRYGARIGYFQGDNKLIVDDCMELKPTTFCAVPRLMNRVHSKILFSVNSNPVTKLLFKMAMKSKKRDIENGIIRKDTVWDKLIFNKIQAKMGGNVRFMCSGSAPLSPIVLADLRCVFGVPIIEGYGSTECSGLAALNIPGCSTTGNVGPPLPTVYIKLVDVPEMNYFVKNNQGEICIKGPTVFHGYLNNEEKTAETLTEDNWLLTGDIGMWTPEGCLKIIDRRKHLFKLSHGEFIAPEKIENIVLLCPYLLQAFVYGDGSRDCVVCVAVVDPDTFPSLGEDLGLSMPLEELCNDDTIKKEIMKQIKDLSMQNGLTSLEQVRSVYLTTEEFSVENSLLTPTFKMKRTNIVNRFLIFIEDMYQGVRLKDDISQEYK